MGISRDRELRAMQRTSFWDEVIDADERQRVADVVRSLGVQQPTEMFSESYKQRNLFVASGDSSVLPVFSSPHNEVLGVNYQVRLGGNALRIKQSARFLNTTFKSAGVYASPRIVIHGSSDTIQPVVVFTHCTFVRDVGHGTAPLIEIRDGARVVFMGCSFISLEDATTAALSHDAGMIQMVPALELGVDQIAVGSAPDFDTGFRTYVPHTLAVGDYVYIADTVTGTSVNGVHAVKTVSSDTTFLIEVDASSVTVADRGTVYKFTGPNVDGHTAYTPLAAGTLTYTQLIGCSRFPVGHAYTTVNADPFVSKIGCI